MKLKNSMNIVAVALTILLSAISPGAQAALITIPSATLDSVEGNSQFVFDALRSQWFYGDSLFVGGPITILGLQLRQGDGYASGSTNWSSFRIDMSSTAASHPLGALDTNHGADRTTVFDDSLSRSYIGGTGPNSFFDAILFSTPFEYDPTSGLGLLIDFASVRSSFTGGELLADRAASTFLDTASAFSNGYRGANDSLVTRLVVAEVPEPATLALIGVGLLGAGFARRNRS